MKTCPDCKTDKPLDQFYLFPSGSISDYCKPCHNAKNRAYYQRNKEARKIKLAEWRDANRDKLKVIHRNAYLDRRDEMIANACAEAKTPEGRARTAINNAVAQKKILKPKVCSACSQEKRLDGHHFDYAKPLDVIWLCRKCHKAVHAFMEHGTPAFLETFKKAVG